MRINKQITGWQGIKDFIKIVLVFVFLFFIGIGAVIWVVIIYIIAQGKNGKDFLIKTYKKFKK